MIRRYVPFASLGVVLALGMSAAVPRSIPSAQDPAPVPELEPTYLDSEGTPESSLPISRSASWLERHSLKPRATLARPNQRVDGERVHAEPRAKRR